MALQLLSTPERTYEIDATDVEYRKDADRSYLARIYQPRGTGPFPALIEIHGGAWTSNDRLQNAPLVSELASSGLVIASVDFRSGKEAPYPASVADINFATRWLKAHVAEFAGAPDGLGGLGLSSGGHLVMLSAMRPHDRRYTEFDLDTRHDAGLAYVMMGWPVIDPHARYLHAKQHGRTSLLESHHAYFGNEDAMREANPQLILERGESVALPPALIFQGADDDVLAPRTAERFVEAYGRAGGVIELALFPRAGHGYSREGGPNARRTVDVLRSFIRRQLTAIEHGY